MEPPKRLALSPLEWIVAVLCVVYGGLLTVWMLTPGQGSFRIVLGALALVSFLATFTLLRGDRTLASACQYAIALCWLLICLLVLGILALCGDKDAPGYGSVLLGGIGAALLTALHLAAARHIRLRSEG
jgi:hypothetical protein